MGDGAVLAPCGMFTKIEKWCVGGHRSGYLGDAGVQPIVAYIRNGCVPDHADWADPVGPLLFFEEYCCVLAGDWVDGAVGPMGYAEKDGTGRGVTQATDAWVHGCQRARFGICCSPTWKLMTNVWFEL